MQPPLRTLSAIKVPNFIPTPEVDAKSESSHPRRESGAHIGGFMAPAPPAPLPGSAAAEEALPSPPSTASAVEASQTPPGPA
eukprot:8100686-Pyramimonas_sp.AAC.1